MPGTSSRIDGSETLNAAGSFGAARMIADTSRTRISPPTARAFARERNLIDDQFVALDVVAPVQAPAAQTEVVARDIGRALADHDFAFKAIDAGLAVQADGDVRRHRRIESRERPKRCLREQRARAARSPRRIRRARFGSAYPS